MKSFAIVLSCAVLLLSACNTFEARENAKEEVNPSTGDIVGSWTLCSEDYQLSSPNGYFQTISFAQDGTSELRRRSFVGTNCADQSKPTELLLWTTSYRLGAQTNSGQEIFSMLRSVSLTLNSDSKVDEANKSKLWGYSDWQKDEAKSLLNRRESEKEGVDFQSNVEGKGSYYIENGKLHFNPGFEESDAGLYKVVGLSRAP